MYTYFCYKDGVRPKSSWTDGFWVSQAAKQQESTKKQNKTKLSGILQALCYQLNQKFYVAVWPLKFLERGRSANVLLFWVAGVKSSGVVGGIPGRRRLEWMSSYPLSLPESPPSLFHSFLKTKSQCRWRASDRRLKLLQIPGMKDQGKAWKNKTLQKPYPRIIMSSKTFQYTWDLCSLCVANQLKWPS